MILRIRPGWFRYSSILATTRQGLERFDSLDAMPPVLRARCLKALESRESGTVIIAGKTAPDGAEEPATPPAAGTAAPAPPSEPRRPARTGRAAVVILLHLLLAALGAAWYFSVQP
jgi:hypothetical protein